MANQKSLVDYTFGSWMGSYVKDGCKYPICFMVDYMNMSFEDDGIEPSGSYTVVVVGPKGTLTGTMDPTNDGRSFVARDREFIGLVGQEIIDMIINTLKPKLSKNTVLN